MTERPLHEMFISPKLWEQIYGGEVSPSVSMWRPDTGGLETPADPKKIVSMDEATAQRLLIEAQFPDEDTGGFF